jgi:hypothetical protein
VRRAHDDRAQPALEGAWVREPREARESLDEAVLHEIVELGVPGQEAEREAVDEAHVPAEERLGRPALPAARGLDELRIGGTRPGKRHDLATSRRSVAVVDRLAHRKPR